jgi:hypothetical protein
VKLISFVLLSSPALESDGRHCFWQSGATHPPDSAAFLNVYRSKGDEGALADFLLVLNNPECAQRLFEAARGNADASETAYAFLMEQTIMDLFEEKMNEVFHVHRLPMKAGISPPIVFDSNSVHNGRLERNLKGK